MDLSNNQFMGRYWENRWEIIYLMGWSGLVSKRGICLQNIAFHLYVWGTWVWTHFNGNFQQLKLGISSRPYSQSLRASKTQQVPWSPWWTHQTMLIAPPKVPYIYISTNILRPYVSGLTRVISHHLATTAPPRLLAETPCLGKIFGAANSFVVSTPKNVSPPIAMIIPHFLFENHIIQYDWNRQAGSVGSYIIIYPYHSPFLDGEIINIFYMGL